MTGQRVLVTGSTGVLGRRVVPLLVEAGHTVTAVVRSETKAVAARAGGATPVEVDLFDRRAMRAALAGFDTVAHLATHIPTGPSALQRSGWRVNDSLRREASAVIAGAAVDAGVGRMIQESITFPYIDGGEAWIDEQCERQYYWGNDSVAAAEASASGVTCRRWCRRCAAVSRCSWRPTARTPTAPCAPRKNGLFTLVGPIDGYVSFIHIDDAAAAVVAALSAPAGVYNVAEPEPLRRSAHRDALAEVVGQSKLRPVPAVVEPPGSDVVNSLARSHRISSQLLRGVSAWTPKIHCIDRWKELG